MNGKTWIAAALAAASLVAACATGPGPDLDYHRQQIEAARTRADHEKLAQEYKLQEAQARRNAAVERQRAASYLRWGLAGRQETAVGLANHCKALAEQYERAAAEYAAVALLHQQLAAQAGN